MRLRRRHLAHPVTSARSFLTRRAERRERPATATDRHEPGAAPSADDEFRRVALDGLRALNRTNSIRAYHPLFGLTAAEQAEFPQPKRLVDIRWERIQPNLPATGSALDIGSQYGWFTFNLAEHGLHAVGVEYSGKAVRVSQLLTVYNRANRAAFLQMDVSPATVRALPAVDVVVCMAIFHHWVRTQGYEAAKDIMEALADRCRDRLFFESGQVDDTDSVDRSSIGFMGDSPKHWLEGFLRGLGFAQVTHLGELPRAGTNERTRHLFMASR